VTVGMVVVGGKRGDFEPGPDDEGTDDVSGGLDAIGDEGVGIAEDASDNFDNGEHNVDGHADAGSQQALLDRSHEFLATGSFCRERVGVWRKEDEAERNLWSGRFRGRRRQLILRPWRFSKACHSFPMCKIRRQISRTLLCLLNPRGKLWTHILQESFALSRRHPVLGDVIATGEIVPAQPCCFHLRLGLQLTLAVIGVLKSSLNEAGLLCQYIPHEQRNGHRVQRDHKPAQDGSKEDQMRNARGKHFYRLGRDETQSRRQHAIPADI
jgi:hypothetical protein